MQARLIISFRRFTEAEFQTRVGLIIASLTGNARFPEPWPAPVATLAQLSAAFDAYRTAYHAATTRDTNRIRERTQARETLTTLLTGLVPYLELVAQGDEAALQSTGFELRRDATRLDRSEPLPAPDRVRLAHGPFSGEIDVRIARVEGAGSYELQVAQGDPADEANWRHAQSSTGLRVTLRQLTRMQPCWVRARGINGPNAGRWSEASSIVVL